MRTRWSGATGSAPRGLKKARSPFSASKRALSADVGEGKGKVWYSIKECITAKPRPAHVEIGEEQETAPAPAEEQEVEEVKAEVQEPHPPADETGEKAAVEERVQMPRGVDEVWRELEEFIREHAL